MGRCSRLCAARAALRAKHASALLLDEPAAALDSNAEEALLNALATLVPKLTIITVAVIILVFFKMLTTPGRDELYFHVRHN